MTVVTGLKRYDLFTKLPDDSLSWVGAEDDLTEATAKMKHLAAKTGLEHFVYDQSEGKVVATSRRDSRARS